MTVCVAFGEDGVLRRIHLIGDSTVSNYAESKFPMAGWGQVLHYFFDKDIEILNHAIGGRSSRSFIEEGRWTTVKSSLQKGDFLLIQFGHNDRDFSKPERYTSVADYKTYLKQYVNEARLLGGIPVLVSPMVMNAWNNAVMRNVFTESGNDYRGAMAEVAKELDVPFVDLNMKSWNYFKNFDYEYCSRFYYNRYLAGEYPNYPDGINDGTHFQETGAIAMARFIVEGLDEIDNPYTCPLKNYIAPQYAVQVSSNIANPGSITKTMTYPAGCPATVKVLPSTGNSFKYWAIDGKNTATSTIYRFTMPQKPVGATAIFNSNTNPQPTIQIDAPANNTTLAIGSNIEIKATASSPNGTINKVVFYADNKIIAEDNTAPYSTILNNAMEGTYTIFATAIDNTGVSVGSLPVVINVSNENEIEYAFKVEAEAACSFKGTIDANHTGFSGNGFVNVENAIGANIVFKLTAEEATTVQFNIRYANGTTGNRNSAIVVNNQVQITEQVFAPTGAWTNWKNLPIDISLQAGTNSIEFRATSENGGANFDAILYNSPVAIEFGCEDPKKTQEIQLQKGWNLISINVMPASIIVDGRDVACNVSTVFAGLDVLEIKSMEAYWKKGNLDFLNSLQIIEPGKGYLVKMYTAGTLSVTGTPISFSNFQITTFSNWILIGCPFQTPTPFSDYFNTSNCEIIKNFEGFWQPNNVLNSINSIEPGKGYFIQGK
ncbi:MAG: hypothetical protein IPO21_10595 [Bacteroidales bacterium]|nr:hypothetical protein [Bacteroidales bacterium]